MSALTIALAVLVGISLGLLGGGGSILTVPLLAYVGGLDAKAAIATSLLVVAVTSAVGAVSHARAGRVDWRTALTFAAAGMAGAFLGGVTSKFIPGSALLVAFAAVMITAGVAMLRGRSEHKPTGRATRLPLVKIAAEGLVVGFVTGLIGAGGGFLVVPALVMLAGLAMPVAIGTSLVVIALNSAAGLAGHLTSGHIDWRLAGAVTAAAVAGALIGSLLTGRVKPDVLRQAFGWFVLVMASVILAQEVHPAVGLTAAAVTALAGVLCLSCRMGIFCPLRALYPRG